MTTASISIVALISILQSSNSSSTNQSTTTQGGTKLEGTKLQDFIPVANVPQLEIADLAVGTGAAVKAGDTITVDYTGAIAATGIIFQSSLDTGQSVTLSLNQVITGWGNGLVGMKVGGTRRLLIPADQAYGANPPSGSGIPANAPVVFDITLHSIGQ
jgi:FKBP-type peptidyl-prolyl cis-trans isomerase